MEYKEEVKRKLMFAKISLNGMLFKKYFKGYNDMVAEKTEKS